MQRRRRRSSSSAQSPSLLPSPSRVRHTDSDSATAPLTCDDDDLRSAAPPLSVLLCTDTLYLVFCQLAHAPRRLLATRLVCRLWREVAQRVFTTQRCVLSLGARPHTTPLELQALRACAEWVRSLRLSLEDSNTTPLTVDTLSPFPTLLARAAAPSSSMWPPPLPPPPPLASLLPALTLLTRLDVAHCTWLRDQHIGTLATLTRLDADYCVGLTDAALLPLTRLEHLSIDWCTGGVTARSLARLTALRYLSARACRGVDNTALGALSGLRTLYIAGEPYVSPTALTQLSSLTELSLCYWSVANLCALFQLDTDGRSTASHSVRTSLARRSLPLPSLERLRVGWSLGDADVPEFDAALACRGVEMERVIYDDDADAAAVDFQE